MRTNLALTSECRSLHRFSSSGKQKAVVAHNVRDERNEAVGQLDRRETERCDGEAGTCSVMRMESGRTNLCEGYADAKRVAGGRDSRYSSI